jgi:hypothetical protein
MQQLQRLTRRPLTVLPALFLAALLFAPPVLAQPASLTYGEDYTLSEEVHSVVTVKVAANRVEHYLAGLSTGWTRGRELAMEMGMLKDYKIYVSELENSGDFNVMLVQIYENAAQRSMLEDPDRMAAFRERMEAIQSEAESFEQSEGYSQIREINGDYLMREVEMED